MKIHFIGIGGIGISALARYYLAQGHQVSGSDLVESEITEALRQQGANVFIGHHPDNIPSGTDRVIYTTAVKENDPELEQARQSEVQVQSNAEALGELIEEYFTIAIAGTHGKSTTAAMTASILIEAGLDPTVILGTKFDKLEYGNCRVGERFLVIEADEWNKKFLNYYPEIITLTNIELEHLDCYQNLNDIVSTYQEFISHLPPQGKLIANQDYPQVKDLEVEAEVQGFSFQQPEAKKLKKLLKVPGAHNVYNALAALETARALGIPDQKSFEALSNFKGVWRRFDIKEKTLKSGSKITLINDYAHHPSEIRATLETASQEFPDQEQWVVFQPHQTSRTSQLFDQFREVFEQVPFDRLIITDIYRVAGREPTDREVSGSNLAEKIERDSVKYVPRPELKSLLLENLDQQLLILMGAGDIYQLEADLTE